ncbi:MAG: DoxX family protein, partial [Bacteriovorax sp.]|nr:DoxX family protein [Bacteriovorax sp.]
MDSSIDNTVIKKRSFLKMLELYITVIFFVLAGARHFITPEHYIRMMPNYLPAHSFLVYTSGFFAILGGIGLMIPRLRSFSAWGLMSLLLAVLPANIYLYTHNV